MRAPLAVLALFAVAGPAWAAADGTRGASSTATVEVSTTVENAAAETVRISGLQDLDFGTIGLETPDDGGGSRVTPACFYHTSATFSVTVTQVGGGVGTPFRLLGPGDAAIPLGVFLVALVRGSVTSDYSDVGYVANGLVGNREDPSCATGNRAEVLVGRPPQVTELPSGIYSATISIVMAVE